MKPLVVLLSAFVMTVFATKIFNGIYDYSLSGRIAMSAMLLFTCIGHFAFTRGMAMMLPESVPNKRALVYFTGVVEAEAAVGLLVPATIKLTGWMLIIFFVLLLPANISAAKRRVDYQKGSFDGPGLNYLWFRVPLQALFIAWVYFFAIM